MRFAAATLALAAAVAADPTAARAEAPTFLAGPRLGGLLPLSQAGPSFTVGLEAGVQLLFDEQLGAVVEAEFRRPVHEVQASDPRVPSGRFTAKVADPELALFAGPRFMFRPDGDVVPFGAVGISIHFLRSEVEGSAGGVAFGETVEQSTEAGLGLRGGVGLKLGPGLATASLSLDLAPLAHRSTGDTRSSALSLSVAYLFGF